MTGPLLTLRELAAHFDTNEEAFLKRVLELVRERAPEISDECADIPFMSMATVEKWLKEPE